MNLLFKFSLLTIFVVKRLAGLAHMNHQFAGVSEISRRTYVDPRAFDRLIGHFASLGNGLLDEIRSVHAVVRAKAAENPVGENIDSGICVIAV